MMMKGPLGFSCIIDSVPYPASFGHEPTGVVEKIGSEVTRFAVGDRVSGAGGGAFASHIISSEFAPLVKLPDNVSEYKCLAEPVMCCCNIVHAVEMKKEDGWLAVVGCGYMGQVCLSLLHAYGVKNIVAFDLHEERRKRALELGALMLLTRKILTCKNKLLNLPEEWALTVQSNCLKGCQAFSLRSLL